MRIPKIIHQTWKSQELPESFAMLSKTWLEFNPDWQYRFWTDDDNRNFVIHKFPHLLEFYDGFETNIQRADMIRYLILYEIGGVYVDMDFECFANLETLLNEHGCVFSTEPQEHCEMHCIDSMLCNAFMASVPKHIFLKLLIEEVIKPSVGIFNPNARVMETTGPFMVTRVYKAHMDLKDLVILDPKYVFPLTKKEVQFLLDNNGPTEDLQKKLDDSFAVHYWLNTWLV